MTYEINETHDQNLKSWVESANTPDTNFPIQNLPFCVFSRSCTYENMRVGVAIGDFILMFSLVTKIVCLTTNLSPSPSARTITVSIIR